MKSLPEIVHDNRKVRKPSPKLVILAYGRMDAGGRLSPSEFYIQNIEDPATVYGIVFGETLDAEDAKAVKELIEKRLRFHQRKGKS